MTNENLEKRILIGDDQPELIQRILSFGFDNQESIEYATKPEKVVELVKNRNYNLVVTDCNYSQDTIEEGFDVIRKIRSFDKNVPIYMYSSGSYEERALEQGANGFINKTDYGLLKETINRYLKGGKK